jgi:hypothetical protein
MSRRKGWSGHWAPFIGWRRGGEGVAGGGKKRWPAVFNASVIRIEREGNLRGVAPRMKGRRRTTRDGSNGETD